MKYTTQGNVRGECGHSHRSMMTAVKCLRRDGRDCERAGGYSDRMVRVDLGEGEWRHLNDDEWQEYMDADAIADSAWLNR